MIDKTERHFEVELDELKDGTFDNSQNMED